MKPFKIQYNIILVFNEHDQMDGDARGVFLYVDNEDTMRPIVKKNYAIPEYAPYLDRTKVRELISWLKESLRQDAVREE